MAERDKIVTDKTAGNGFIATDEDIRRGYWDADSHVPANQDPMNYRDKYTVPKGTPEMAFPVFFSTDDPEKAADYAFKEENRVSHGLLTRPIGTER